jgi:hypothetical protein
MTRNRIKWYLRHLVYCLTVLGPPFALPSRAAEPPLVLERTIALHDVRGRIDHMAIDLTRNRLLVAELGNDSVDVIDLAAGVVAHRITGLR